MIRHLSDAKFSYPRALSTLTLVCSGAIALACSSSGDDTGAVTGGAGGAQAGGAGANSGGTTTATGGSTGTAGGTTTAGGSSGSSAAGGGAGGAAALASFTVQRTDLDSDQAGAAQTDANLVNAWGIAINPTAEVFWVSSNGGGSTPVYDATGAIKPVDPKVAPLSGTGPGSPTGQVFNGSMSFMADKFIVDTLDGQVMGWPGTGDFVQRAKKDGASYTGLALVGTGTAQMLVGTDFHDGTVDLYGADYGAVTMAGAFSDTTIPAGFAPFNVMPIGDSVYVTYAKQDAAKANAVAGAGNGYVSLFATDGTFQKTLISQGALNAPWAVALAPASFAAFANMLLVGNFGDGTIHAYDPTSGAALGQLATAAGDPLIILGLWDLKVGPTGTTDLSSTLFFSAGPTAGTHGLFGKLDAVAPTVAPY